MGESHAGGGGGRNGALDQSDLEIKSLYEVSARPDNSCKIHPDLSSCHVVSSRKYLTHYQRRTRAHARLPSRRSSTDILKDAV